MAKASVLEEAIKKLRYNSMVLQEKRSKCTNKQQVNEIDKNLAQNESMILDYQYRLSHNLG